MKVINHFIVSDADDIYEIDNGTFVWRHWERNCDGHREWHRTFQKEEIGELFAQLSRFCSLIRVQYLASIQPFYSFKPIIDEALREERIRIDQLHTRKH